MSGAAEAVAGVYANVVSVAHHPSGDGYLLHVRMLDGHLLPVGWPADVAPPGLDDTITIAIYRGRVSL